MKDERRYLLRFGPYSPPNLKVGDWIECARFGRVQVARWTDAPIPWPCARHRNKPLILCGDLERALQQETAIAIAHWWGVGLSAVRAWRKVYGVSRYTEGWKALRREIVDESVSPERLALMTERALTPEADEKRRRTLAERPRQEIRFTPRGESLLGTMSDRALANLLGCPTTRVAQRRKALGLPAFGRRKSRNWNHRLMTVFPERLKERRQSRGWSVEDIIGKSQIAGATYRRLERGTQARASHKVVELIADTLGCDADDFSSAPEAEAIPLSPDEIALLGTMSDAALARRLGCGKNSLAIWRRTLGIPAWRKKQAEKRQNDWPRVSVERIMARCLEEGLSQPGLTSRIGRDRTYFHKLGKKPLQYVPPEVMMRLCEALRCSPKDLQEPVEPTQS